MFECACHSWFQVPERGEAIQVGNDLSNFVSLVGYARTFVDVVLVHQLFVGGAVVEVTKGDFGAASRKR